MRSRATIIQNWNTLFLCCKCNRYLSRECFWKATTTKDWIQTYCKECRRQYSKDNREMLKEKNHNRYLNNKDKIIKDTSDYRRKKVKSIWFGRERFHQNVRWYCKDAWLVFDTCFVCWCNENIILHHPSYENRDMRSVVVPLCKSCHLRVHSLDIVCPEPINILDIAPWYCKSRKSWSKKDEHESK